MSSCCQLLIDSFGGTLEEDIRKQTEFGPSGFHLLSDLVQISDRNSPVKVSTSTLQFRIPPE